MLFLLIPNVNSTSTFTVDFTLGINFKILLTDVKQLIIDTNLKM